MFLSPLFLICMISLAIIVAMQLVTGFLQFDNSLLHYVKAASSNFNISSPSFGMQEIEVVPHNWIDIWRGLYSSKGSNYTDLRTVNYNSNGKHLNATLWLDAFNPSPPTDREINYGMYIDADFNNKTGIEGIDYKVEVGWNGTAKTWTRVFEEWSTNGKSRILDLESNYTGFYDVRGHGKGSYVLLHADLDKMLFPSRYRVLFYAEEIKSKGLNWIMDSSKWIYIPPPQFVISTLPKLVDVRAGDQKSIEVQVKSTKGFEPSVQLAIPNQEQGSQQPNSLRFKFAYDKLHISSFGEATTPLTIYTSKDALRYPYTGTISAAFTFPSQEFFAKPIFGERKIIIPAENISTQSTLTIAVQDPLTTIDIINDFWSKVGGLINFLYLAGGAIASWFFTSYVRSKNKNKNKNEKGNL